ncbi:MAG TPA: hypothetical protein VIS99_07030 [Terrimicrobiaceae bacterium]
MGKIEIRRVTTRVAKRHRIQAAGCSIAQAGKAQKSSYTLPWNQDFMKSSVLLNHAESARFAKIAPREKGEETIDRLICLFQLFYGSA